MTKSLSKARAPGDGARQLRLRVKDGTSQCACERSSSWEAAWKPPETTQAALADACRMLFSGNDGREHAMSRTQGGALDGVDGSSARQAAERRQQAAP